MPGRSPELDAVDTGAWDALHCAAGDHSSVFRYLTLCTVDAAQHPQARTVVLRNVMSDLRQIEFHTDIRSSKWKDLSRQKAVQILGLDMAAGLQLRLSGRITLFAPQSARAQQIWDTLPEWTRNTYGGGPPGKNITDGDIAGSQDRQKPGRFAFGVLSFQADTLDWVSLQRGANRRAKIRYDNSGACVGAQWVYP